MLRKLLLDCIPVLFSNKKSFGFRKSSVNKAGSSIKGNLKHSNDSACKPPDLKRLNFIDFISYIVTPFGNEGHLVNIFKFFKYYFFLLKTNRLEVLNDQNNEALEHLTIVKILETILFFEVEIWKYKVFSKALPKFSIKKVYV
jgi:hypothetical protein